MTTYTLAIIPSVEVTKFVEDFFRDFDVYRHTTLPPHITVVPPFLLNNTSEEQFVTLLLEKLKNNFSFEITLEKIGNFRGRNNVIFIEPSFDSTKKIAALAKDVEPALESAQSHTTQDFHPHLTLARHVPRHNFPSVIWEAKKRFSPMSFRCKGVTLFENSGRGWNSLSTVKFTD